MGTTKKATSTKDTTKVTAEPVEEEREVVIPAITKTGKDAIRKGSKMIATGGTSSAKGAFLIAEATQKVIEQKGGKYLTGTTLAEARGTVRAVAEAVIPDWSTHEAAVDRAVVGLTSLLVRVCIHRANCLTDGTVEVSTAAIKFRALRRDGLMVEKEVVTAITSALGGHVSLRPGAKDVRKNIVADQERFLQNIVDAVTDGTKVLTGRKGREYIRELRGMVKLVDVKKQNAAGRGGKKKSPTIMAVLEDSQAGWADVDYKAPGATDAALAGRVLSELKNLEKVYRSLGPCAGRTRIEKFVTKFAA